jgi:hypothetical protein
MTAHLIVCTTRRSGVHHQTITSGTADDHVWYSRRSRLPASADVVLPDDHVCTTRRSRLHHQTITSARYTFSSAHPDVLVCSVHLLVGSPRRARLLGTRSRRLAKTCSSARYTFSSAHPDVLVCSVHALVGSPRRARLLGTRSRRLTQACSSARYTLSSARPDVLVCSVHALVGSARRARPAPVTTKADRAGGPARNTASSPAPASLLCSSQGTLAALLTRRARRPSGWSRRRSRRSRSAW